jgi:hypothetical protein
MKLKTNSFYLAQYTYKSQLSGRSYDQSAGNSCEEEKRRDGERFPRHLFGIWEEGDVEVQRGALFN